MSSLAESFVEALQISFDATPSANQNNWMSTIFNIFNAKSRNLALKYFDLFSMVPNDPHKFD